MLLHLSYAKCRFLGGHRWAGRDGCGESAEERHKLMVCRRDSPRAEERSFFCQLAAHNARLKAKQKKWGGGDKPRAERESRENREQREKRFEGGIKAGGTFHSSYSLCMFTSSLYAMYTSRHQEDSVKQTEETKDWQQERTRGNDRETYICGKPGRKTGREIQRGKDRAGNKEKGGGEERQREDMEKVEIRHTQKQEKRRMQEHQPIAIGKGGRENENRTRKRETSATQTDAHRRTAKDQDNNSPDK